VDGRTTQGPHLSHLQTSQNGRPTHVPSRAPAVGASRTHPSKPIFRVFHWLDASDGGITTAAIDRDDAAMLDKRCSAITIPPWWVGQRGESMEDTNVIPGLSIWWLACVLHGGECAWLSCPTRAQDWATVRCNARGDSGWPGFFCPFPRQIMVTLLEVCFACVRTSQI
jgi:hypothetical protein